jgi:hypothetical protein
MKRGKAGRLTYVGEPSRLAQEGAVAPGVNRDALLTSLPRFSSKLRKSEVSNVEFGVM